MEEGHEIEGDIARLRAFKCPAWKRVLYHALGVLTLGLLYLVAFWSNGVRLALTYSDCGLADADAVYVQLKDKRAGICQVKRLPRDGDHQQQQQRYFEFHKVRFLWLETQHAFRAAPDTPPALPRLALECASAVEEQAEHQHGPHGSAVGAAPSPAPAPGPACPPEDVRTRHAAEYGANVLSVDPPSAVRIFLHDALQPFYVFQYFSVVLWAFEDYYLYSGIVLLITMGSIIANVWSQYIERKRMAELAYHVEDVTLLVSDVNHARSRTVMRLAGSSADLVPGDVIVVVPGKVPCDILLLSGECVADETVLTGECVPVRKVAYAPEGDGGSYHPDSLPQVTLFSGTTVLSARGAGSGRAPLGMVARTGFNTAKGRLLRSILFPKQHDLQFARQALYFIAMMLSVASVFYAIDVAFMVQYGASGFDIFIKFLDMITVAVPPALACCLAIAITISVFRLTQSSIHVLDNERVTAAGLLNNVCFDKTGTLTEIGLVLSSVIPSSGGHFLHALSQPDQTLPALVRLLFAACHGLTHLDNSSSSSGGAEGAEGHAGASAAPGARGADGPLVVGDPLEQILFEAAGFDMAFVECGRPGAGGAGGGGGGMQLQVRPKAAWPPPTGAAAGAGGALLSPSQDGGSSKFADRGSTDRGSIELSVVPLMGGDSSGASSPQAAAAPWSDAASAMGAFAEAEPQHPMEPLLGVRLPPGASVAVLRRFDFSSERMRSSCVVAMPGEGGVPRRLLLLVKGSPEKVHELCDAASVPRSFDTALQGYTDQGLRVLAMAYRELGSEGEAGSFGGDVIGGGGVAAAPLWLSSSQDELEAGATFLGLVLMENKLKPDSAPTIAHLQRGGMSTCMVTGDHVRTGVTVARQCGILPAGVAAVVMDAAKGPLQSVVLTFQWLEPAGAAAAAAGDEGAFGAGAATPRKPSHGSGGGIPGGGAPSPAVPPVLLSVSDAMRRVACGSCAMAATGRAFSKVAAAEQARARARRRAARKAARGAGMVTCAGHGHGHDRSAVGSDDAEAGDSGGGSGGFEAEGEDASSGGVPHGLFGLMLGACRVYARMSPDDKRDLVELLGPGQGDEGDSDSDDDERGGGGRGGGAAGGRSGGGGGADRAKALAKAVAEPEYATAGRGDHVGFCGDGANDLGALKAALVGVSLCDAEASIAAPLTSTNPSVSCMVTVVAEGRCALVTSLIIFKYTMVYAFIQVLALALLYQMGLIVGNYQYLLQDMFHTTLLASLMGLTQPAKNLGPRRPPTQVLSAAVIVPVVGQLVVVTAFQIGALKALQAQSWYTPFDTSANPTLDVATSETRPENGVLFIISCWQLVISAFVFNVHLGGGASFRRAIWTNTWLLGAMLALCAFNLYVLWAPEDPFKAEVPAVVGMPLELRAILFGIVCGNLAAALGVDALANAANAQAEARGGWGPAWARAFGRGAAASVGAQRSGGLIRPLGSLEGSQLLAGLPLSSIAVQ